MHKKLFKKNTLNAQDDANFWQVRKCQSPPEPKLFLLNNSPSSQATDKRLTSPASFY